MKFLRLSNYQRQTGFTIVELLVVIVVIGVLAAITIVAYTGITSKATLTSLISDLNNSSRQLKVFQTINGNYPATISIDCTSTPDTTANKCLKLSPGNTITSLTNDYSVNNSTSPQTFSLTIKNSNTNIISVITDSSKPAVLVPAPLNPVADWIATPIDNGITGDHYGNFYDTVSKTYASVTRAGIKTIYDPATQHIYDVPPNKLAINPRSDGKSGSEAVVEESRTNVLLNSDFETDSNSDGIPDSWSGPYVYAGGIGAAAIDTSQKVHQSKSIKITKTNEDGQVFVVTDPTVNTANTYTYSCWVKSNTTSAYIDTYTGTGWSATNVQSNQLNQWVRLSTTFVATAPSSMRVAIYGASGIAYFEDCQLEVGASATSYIPTTVSAVTRNADIVTVPTTSWGSSNGSVLGVIGAPGSTLDSDMFSKSNDGAGLQSAMSSGEFYPKMLGGNLALQSPDNHITTSLPGVVGVTWNNTNTYGYSNGSATSVGTIVARTSSSVAMRIGARIDGAMYYNGPISRVVTYTTALSPSDVTTVTNTVKDGP